MKKINKTIIALSLISVVLSGIANAEEVKVALADANDEITLAIDEGSDTYALLGFKSFPFVIDITDEYTPLLVEGYEVLEAENSEGMGAFLNYEGAAVIFAVGFDNIIDIDSI